MYVCAPLAACDERNHWRPSLCLCPTNKMQKGHLLWEWAEGAKGKFGAVAGLHPALGVVVGEVRERMSLPSWLGGRWEAGAACLVCLSLPLWLEGTRGDP